VLTVDAVHGAFDLDWNLIRSFVAVARAGSLAGAAKQLGVAHPTVARHLQQLEESLGFTLFARSARGLVMNEAGQRLFSAAAPMQDAALQLRNTVDVLGNQPPERIRITVSDLLAELLPALSEHAPELYPGTGVSVDVLVTPNRLNLLEREADIALRHIRPTQQELICRRVGVVRMNAFAAEGYLRDRGRLSRCAVEGHRLIDSLDGKDFLDVLRGQGFSLAANQVVFRSDSLACQKSAAKAGWGIGAFPEASVLPADGLFPALTEGDPVEIPVWLVARPEVRENRTMKTLFDGIGRSMEQRLAAALRA
jgi:DNA-binding transcriptional LysR family regulator